MASNQSIASVNESYPFVKPLRRKSTEKRKPSSPSDSLQESSEEFFLPDFVSKVISLCSVICSSATFLNNLKLMGKFLCA